MSGRGKSHRSLVLIEAARHILSEIQPASVRAVCYRLFTEGLIDNMSKAETNRVSTQLTWAREHGVIPWPWIVDETRSAERVNAWENPGAYVESVKRCYRRDRWADQAAWIEVWSEKGTIRGTLAPVLEAYGVTLRVMHGYGSSTALYQAACESANSHKTLHILYVGDWDPSGLHMSECDLPDRLMSYGAVFDIERLALTASDTALEDLPWFPAATKKGDPRHGWFAGRYGSRCWELDALSPVVMRERVEEAIRDRIDFAAWDRAAVTEAAETASLAALLSTWQASK